MNIFEKPQAILITCVDSRIVSSRITQTNPGETFVSRNPGERSFNNTARNKRVLKINSCINSIKKGNLIPNFNVLNPKTPRPEEAALELACVYNNIDTIVLSGHSDCKVDPRYYSAYLI